ncbi:hypothetical protein OE88DRAFT_833717 [Heliocybe sulcata]|uniref:Uncharacterized protein n=1 Tax=Heliocybe sulcata TaxID=5364 RepID=A0A5C3MQ16_9AGAM|nr:hypothetical protein OE88DRAFT_833717 [Heliocybe sulcata]
MELSADDKLSSSLSTHAGSQLFPLQNLELASTRGRWYGCLNPHETDEPSLNVAHPGRSTGTYGLRNVARASSMYITHVWLKGVPPERLHDMPYPYISTLRSTSCAGHPGLRNPGLFLLGSMRAGSLPRSPLVIDIALPVQDFSGSEYFISVYDVSLDSGAGVLPDAGKFRRLRCTGGRFRNSELQPRNYCLGLGSNNSSSGCPHSVDCELMLIPSINFSVGIMSSACSQRLRFLAALLLSSGDTSLAVAQRQSKTGSADHLRP